MEKENIYWSSFSQKHQPTHWPSLETSSQASKLRYDPLTDRLTGVKCRATSVARNVKHMSRPWYPCPYYKKNLLHHSFSKACVYMCQKCLRLFLVEMLEDDIFFESYSSSCPGVIRPEVQTIFLLSHVHTDSLSCDCTRQHSCFFTAPPSCHLRLWDFHILQGSVFPGVAALNIYASEMARHLQSDQGQW